MKQPAFIKETNPAGEDVGRVTFGTALNCSCLWKAPWEATGNKKYLKVSMFWGYRIYILSKCVS